MKRHRGAQPGNANSRKHGFYSAQLLPLEKKALEEIPVTDLQAEINILRVFLQRFMDSQKDNPSRDFETCRLSLLTACFAANQIAGLVRIQARSKGYLLERSQVKAWLDQLPPLYPGDADPGVINGAQLP